MSGVRAYVGLGANLPFEGLEGPALLAAAARAIEAAGVKVLAISNIWRSAAWPLSDQPDFFNAVAMVEAGQRSPRDLYMTLRSIELKFGRERRERWAARTLDLDVLAIDGRQGDFGEVTLPHPRMHERAFVLAPLAEVAPHWRHPIAGLTAAELLKTVPAEQRYRQLGPFPPH
ncbi:MAG: 2-amino-4-hydroxy-6-hydroxymethyldihydropteridine diphosphokinase [Proteobacteria bacterium]|nr:2-amino-4-hydroxy-6-hydroxymethyldihydropteridine diphosphokinase [Pseudomonadota bacterium]